MKRLDITGERYGNLVAIERLPITPNGYRWLFKCDCGNQTEALQSNVRAGEVRSCGCLGSRNTIGKRSLKHGHGVGFKKSRTAMSWRNAKTRCFNRKNAKYADYGGRGITMCEEWSKDFRVFLRDMGECPEGYTLERIDVNGNYEPGNCEWATKKRQANNKRNTIRVGSVSLSEFSEALGVKYGDLHRRINLGEDPFQAAAWALLKQANLMPRRRSTKRSQRS